MLVVMSISISTGTASSSRISPVRALSARWPDAARLPREAAESSGKKVNSTPACCSEYSCPCTTNGPRAKSS
eukprot:3729910-Prymnesium_polylepis.1